MKHFTFDSHWDAIKGQLKQRYGQLVDDDLVFVEGKGDELLARLQKRLGMSAQDLDALLNELHTTVGGGFGQVKDKVGELASEARAKASEMADDLKARAATLGEEAKAQAGVAYDQARQRVRTLREDGEEYVRQNPRESLLAAVCAGFVAGLLIRR
ncbi:MAG: hypothetical protein WCF18_22385 [Chthoniobacteraceae bacterium]